MYKAVNKTEAIRVYMESLALNTGVPTVHWEVNTSCISFVKAKIFTPRVKHIDIPVFFLQETFDNVIFPQNMISLVSFQKIYSPNHFQVQLSVRVLNGLLG